MHYTLEILGVLFVVIGQAMFLAYKLGRIEENIKSLENKQDKHNGIIERTFSVEQSAKSAHKRLDDGYVIINGLTEKLDDLKDLFMSIKR